MTEEEEEEWRRKRKSDGGREEEGRAHIRAMKTLNVTVERERRERERWMNGWMDALCLLQGEGRG